MVAQVNNIQATRGETITVTVDVTEADGTASNLTGYTGEMQVRATADSDVVLVEGTVAITPLTGRVVGTILAADTEDAEWRVGVYDLRIMSGAIVEYVVCGTITLRDSVTRD